MDGKNTNASNEASNLKKPKTTQGKKEIGTKNNVDIAADLEAFTGREGYVITANCGIAEFIHDNVIETEASASSSETTGSTGVSKFGEIGSINTGTLVIALQNNEVATISVKDEKSELEKEQSKTEKEDREAERDK